MGMHTLYRFNTLQSGNGVGNEFLYIIAAVVGGTLLTGGYGNAIGVAIGAFIFGMTSQCIVYAGWDPNWFKAFLGVMLLLAVDGEPVRQEPLDHAEGGVGMTDTIIEHADSDPAQGRTADRDDRRRQVLRRDPRPARDQPAGQRRRGRPACWATTAPASPP